MYLSHLHIKNHEILGSFDIDFINKKTNKPYSIVAFVGENGCGKTTLLNEIYNYQKSEYINDREFRDQFSIVPYKSLYLWQNSLYKTAMREVRKTIDGKDINNVISGEINYSFGKMSGPLTNNNDGVEIINKLGDKTLSKMFLTGEIEEACSSLELLKVIDGKKHGYDIEHFSSGQQELVLKLKDLKQLNSSIDSILVDEPEISLHPRWQKEVLDIIIDLTTDVNGDRPQIFVATHSEKVLESLLNRDDALIIRLYKEDGEIIYEPIEQMDLCLPTVTFAELDYVVFHIPSLDYHDQLFTHFGEYFDKDTSTGIDFKIEKKANKLYGKNNFEQYRKERDNARFNKVYKTKMLPTYIRDYFHHPNEIEPPTEKELILSIEFLRTLIKNLNVKDIEESE